MPGLYSHTTRATGTVLTAAIYNADHQNHIDNQTPGMTDDYSTDAATMRTTTSPGSSGSESLATSLAGEIERLRYVLEHLNGGVRWYSPATWASLASAATTDLSSVTSRNVLVTGMTTITALGTVAEGVRKTLRFAAALTFTHNGTSLILPGAANITTAADDVAEVVSLGSGNWLCTSYKKADGTAVVSGVSSYGFALENGCLSASAASNALTIAIKTIAGADPSVSDPVKIRFRNVSLASGADTTISLTAATSLVLSNGSTLGTTANQAFRLWITGFNDGGTFRLGAVNLLSGTDIMSLDEAFLYSSTAEGGAGAADSAQVIYTGTAVTSKAMRILGWVEYSSGLGTAGVYASAPTTVHNQNVNSYKPGEVVQTVVASDTAVATGTTTIPMDDTIPQITEGDQYLSKAITPRHACDLLEITGNMQLSHSADTNISAALFQDATAGALAAWAFVSRGNAVLESHNFEHIMLAATVSSTTFKARAGGNSAGTTTFNGQSGGRLYGGVGRSQLKIRELMA